MIENHKPENDIWVRISILESKIQDSEKRFDRLDNSISDVHKKIDQLKDDLRNKKDVPQIESRVEEIESDIESIKLEFPEIKLMKKMVLGLVGFVLTGFLGLLWNAVVINPTKAISMRSPSAQEDLNAIAKKFVEEYRKGDPK